MTTIISSKEQERKALAQIRKIVSTLGEDSYVATAFEGCFEDAEQNIDNDFALSMNGRWQYAEQEIEELKAKIADLESLQNKVAKLEAALEKEQEWQPHESDLNVKQADYDSLANSSSTRTLTDEEAKQLIADEFGFDPSKITVLHSVYKEEINRHRQCRRVGEIERNPVYNATDWNYIRFDCANWYYEMYNGGLRPYYC